MLKNELEGNLMQHGPCIKLGWSQGGSGLFSKNLRLPKTRILSIHFATTMCMREVIYLPPMFIMPYNSREVEKHEIYRYSIEYYPVSYYVFAFFSIQKCKEEKKITMQKRTYFEIFELVNTMFVSENSYCFHKKMSIVHYYL